MTRRRLLWAATETGQKSLRKHYRSTWTRFTSSRVDEGEGSCALLIKKIDADFLITDGLRALPELQTVADAKVAIAPIVPRALVQKNILTDEEAREKLDKLAETREWLGAPIYRKAQDLFD